MSWHTPKFSLLTYILLSLFLAISVNANDYGSSYRYPPGPAAKNEIPLPPMSSVPAETSAEETLNCPIKNEVNSICANESLTTEHLFGEKGLDLWAQPYVREDRCRLWWWAQHVEVWKYAPLSEWASYLQDGLMENVDRKALSKILEFAPLPPRKTLNANEKPIASCQPATGKAQKVLQAKLRGLNLKNLTGEVLKDLVAHCLAFEVETAIWKRISTRIVASFIIPIGDIYFTVIAVPSLNGPSLHRQFASIAAGISDAGLSYSTIGHCPVSKNPRDCIEEFFENDPHATGYGFSNGFTHDLKAVASRANLDSLYDGGKFSRPLDLELTLGFDGQLSFRYRLPDGQTARAWLGVEEGSLALNTNQSICDAGIDSTKPLILRPLAFPREMAKLFDEIAIYRPSDFPEPSTRMTGGIERGCQEPRSYSEWAADTANAAKHYSHHGMPFDSLYRAIALQRFRGRIEARDTASIQNNLVFGKWRQKPVQIPILVGGYGEDQGSAMVKRRPENGGENKLYQLINIDGIRAHQVTYHERAIGVWPEKGENAKAHVIFHRAADHAEIYAQSVIARLVKLESSCQSIEIQKTELLRAIFALIHAAPLEKGNEIVAKVFLAAAYENIFGQKLSSMRKFRNLEIDALTLGFEEFSTRYLEYL